MPTTRVTTFTYDWRNRRTDTDGEVDLYEQTFYDNLDRVTKVDRRNTTSGGNLIARSESKFDDREDGGQVWLICFRRKCGNCSPDFY